MSTNAKSVSSGTQSLTQARHAVRGLLTAANVNRLCSVCLVWVLAGSLTTAHADDPPPWWNSHWRMRLSLAVDVGLYERQDKPVEQFLNFKTLLSGIGRGGEAAIPVSFRVLEVDANGAVIDEAVPFQFEPLTPDSGNLVFLLAGTTATQTQRSYYLYFDTAGDFALPTGTPYGAADVNALVEVVDGVPDEGQDCYMVSTANATYYFQKDAGGFSSLLDAQGNDWIGFHPYGGSDGIYRGIPNMGHPEGYCHPGKTASHSRVSASGPLCVSIESASNDGVMRCRWDIFPHHARLTVFQMRTPYWFLYEGTPGGNPGGQLDEAGGYCVHSDGTRTALSERWDGPLPAPEWLYFGASNVDRALYLVHHQPDREIDSYWPMEHNMTVFGFGRLGLEKFMTQVPAHFTVGFAEDGSFARAQEVIDSAFRPLSIDIS